jgi:general secretion pathway protein N
VTPAAGSGSIGELELTGVIITPTMQMALLYDHQGNRQVRLRAGERVSGGDITLVEVKPRSAVFDTASGRVELRLPAGAAIDASVAPRDAMPEVDDPPPAASVPETSDTPAQRIRALREIIQKRRAAQAAAVHEGEH